jgi:alpha-L-fucosidase
MKKAIATLMIIGMVTWTMSAIGESPYKAKPESLKQWQDARYGMFIHWGPVSITEKEISWSRANTNSKCPNQGPTPAEVYDNLYKKFNPTEFNAKEWVAIAKASGMKYMVLTAKHCDGFLLWDSKVDDYNIMNSPFGRDVCAELAEAAHKAGMMLGWYFSPMDWRDPDCRNDKNAEFVRRMQAELRELLTNYGKIDVLWFDTDGRSSPWDQDVTYSLVRKLQPDIVINNRLDIGGHKEWTVQSIGPWADFYTPEQYVGGFDNQRPWESCMTVSAHNQWAWGGSGDGVKSLESCMNMVISGAGGNGNILMNVGPTPLGEIAPEQANRIKEVGAWLKKYGKSIYGTRGGPFKPGYYGVSTHKGKIIYLHLRNLGGGTITLPGIEAKIKRAKLLTGGRVSYTQSFDVITVTVSKEHSQPIDTIVELTLDRDASKIAPVSIKAITPTQ